MRIINFTKKMAKETKPCFLYEMQDVEFVKIKISEMVKLARAQEGLTQAQLAERVGTKQSSIARLESGKVSPSISFLNEIAKALNTYLIEPRFKSVDHFYSSDVGCNCNFSSSCLFQNPHESGNYVSIYSGGDFNLKS